MVVVFAFVVGLSGAISWYGIAKQFQLANLSCQPVQNEQHASYSVSGIEQAPRGAGVGWSQQCEQGGRTDLKTGWQGEDIGGLKCPGPHADGRLAGSDVR